MTIFHPTDFSESSHTAFRHALRLAFELKTGLTIISGNGNVVGADGAGSRVREMLGISQEHWEYGQMGLVGIDLLGPKDFPTLKKHGLVCALAGSHGFVQADLPLVKRIAEEIGAGVMGRILAPLANTEYQGSLI